MDVFKRIENIGLTCTNNVIGKTISLSDLAELMELAKLGKQMQWMSIENPPKEEGIYFARYINGRIGTGTFFKDLGRFNKGVTHWMPLSPIPKGVE